MGVRYLPVEVSYLLVLRGDHAVRGGGLGVPGRLLKWEEDRDVQECRDNPADQLTRAGSRNDFED